eukprot:581142-Pelagomonas_calceolata.AAC.1
MRGAQQPSPLASMILADMAGSPNHNWNLKSINSDTTLPEASTQHTTTLTSSSSKYHTCSVLGNTYASIRALSTSPIKEQPTSSPTLLLY